MSQTPPDTLVVTADTRLEKLHSRHAASLFQQIDRHRDYLCQFVNWTPFNTQLSDTALFVKKCEQEAEQGIGYVWAICVEGQAVGTLSFNPAIDWQNRTAHIGYWLSPTYQGRGIVSQGVIRLIEATKTHFSRYILKCAVHNLRSNQVATRCGFEWIGQQKNAEQIGEVLYAQNIYQRLE
ncbi:GNAT family N-acetyltransferase [Muribacter muris]|uniref:GNAT family N-acetyltransferase n=1 Tax=Muribacter muris TaxID=67855 RepID=A0A4Y9K2V3_9PAST|nr:GNAT family N-acetyltransferase [Muribacter muris]MBF0784567.1 GNAT family N-acetyltransferase [Muribacter muris]MBF0826137.1 GNAT family N-acetyltransferase [Muribacter muris]TFV12078.1 GNAT family N-acetyltransferase [Muribacter muris]